MFLFLSLSFVFYFILFLFPSFFACLLLPAPSSIIPFSIPFFFFFPFPFSLSLFPPSCCGVGSFHSLPVKFPIRFVPIIIYYHSILSHPNPPLLTHCHHSQNQAPRNQRGGKYPPSGNSFNREGGWRSARALDPPVTPFLNYRYTHSLNISDPRFFLVDGVFSPLRQRAFFSSLFHFFIHSFILFFSSFHSPSLVEFGRVNLGLRARS
ncbi:hypothetical protein HOY82DRAFT_366711 [Tuber indicum]|nr:hypothetical protein HOY82DRAFT_366711 [Tuber indicum]